MFECLSGAGVVAAGLIAPPSGELMMALLGVEAGRLNASAQVDLLVVWERMAAFVAGVAQPGLLAVADTETHDGRDCPFEPEGSGRAEVGAALRLAPQVAEQRLLVAEQLCGRLGCVQTGLLAGDFSYGHAAVIAMGTLELSDELALWVALQVLPKAAWQSIADLRRAVRRAVLKADPSTAKERAVKAKADRSLDWWPGDDGMAEMRVITSAADVMAMVNAVDAMARQDFGRTEAGGRVPVAARRADALVQLVTVGPAGTGTGSGTGAGVRAKATVHVTMDLATVMGFADNPAELAGYGAIDAATARTLAADGVWRRLVCDPLTGALLDLGHTRYEPGAALEAFIRARDVRCEFPHCQQPARRCHLDHTRRYDPQDPGGGRTDRNNLGPLCEHHHQLKHRAGWVLRRDAETAESTWISPTGHVYRVEHEDHRSWADDLQEQNYRLGSARSDSTDHGDGDALVMADREPPVHEPTPEPQAA